MGINYDIETEMCSLRKMCIMNVTQNILENARRDPSTMDIPKSIASKAAEMVSKLDLPQTLNTEIVAIIRPVMKEMLRWYQRYGEEVRVILTHHGTVDMTRSAKAIVASDQPVYQRFVTACEHCLEDDIFTLGKQVTSVMLRERPNPHADFWYDVYGGNFDVKIIGGSLSQEQVIEGLFLDGPPHISAIRYFHERATLKSIEVILDQIWDYGDYPQQYFYITPALCNTYLHDNVMDGEWLEESKNTISTCLLTLLIKWPYQHLFLKSAELLMPNLSKWDFWYIAETISKKLSADYKEYDYKSLFVGFWNLGLLSFKSKLVDDQTVSSIESLAENVFLVKNEFLVSLLFDQILQMDEYYLNNDFHYDLDCVCFQLFEVEAYESIDFLIRMCQTKYQELFLKFHNASRYSKISQTLSPTCTQVEHNLYLDKYVPFMSKYWVLPELE